MTRLILYTTVGCHLCEQAEALLQQLAHTHAIEVEAVDISTTEALVAAYGIRIPVVKNPATNAELGWPFQLEQLAVLVR